MRRRKKQRWQDLSTERRAAIVGLGTVQVSLMVAALWDLIRRPSEQVKGRKGVWAAVCFLNTVGPLSYFAFGRRRVSPPA